MSRLIPRCAYVVLMSAGLLASSICSAESLCSPDETVVFACKFTENHKLVSICASKQASADAGYIQYRYGLPGKVELSYPATRENSQKHFAYDYYTRPDLTAVIFEFNVGTYRYDLSESDEGRGDSGSLSVKLTASSEKTKKSVDLTCGADANSPLDLTPVMNFVPRKDLFGVD